MPATPPRPLPRILVASLLAAACAGAPTLAPRDDAGEAKPVRLARDAVPAALAAAAARGEAALRTLRERIAAQLAAVVAAAGPAGAAELCRGEAPALAAAVTAQTGVEVGRAPARPRDDSDVPTWATPLVEEAAARRAADVAPVVVDLGDRVALLQPIAVGGSCLACHGGAERLAPELAARSGHDGAPATGFKEGDVIGFFWAEARK